LVGSAVRSRESAWVSESVFLSVLRSTVTATVLSCLPYRKSAAVQGCAGAVEMAARRSGLAVALDRKIADGSLIMDHRSRLLCRPVYLRSGQLPVPRTGPGFAGLHTGGFPGPRPAQILVGSVAASQARRQSQNPSAQPVALVAAGGTRGSPRATWHCWSTGQRPSFHPVSRAVSRSRFPIAGQGSSIENQRKGDIPLPKKKEKRKKEKKNRDLSIQIQQTYKPSQRQNSLVVVG